MDLPRREGRRKLLDTHIAKVFYTNAAAGLMLKRLLIFRLFMGQLCLFEMQNGTALEQKKEMREFALKEPIVVVKTYDDAIESALSHSDTARVENPFGKSSEVRMRRCDHRCNNKDAN